MANSGHRGAALAACVVSALGAPALASDLVTAAPAALDVIRVDEHLGAQVPLDLEFRDQDGRAVTLGELVRGDLPVVLTFNYSDCPMLCSMMLNGVVDALPALDQLGDPASGRLGLKVGDQFRLVTVILEPKETPSRAAQTRGHYLDQLEGKRPALRPLAERGGWTFLVAARPDDDTAIRRLADTVGFGYRYVPERAEWAHPATLIFLSATGVVTRYVHGTQFDAEVLSESVMRAGTAEPSAAVGFLQRCFHYDPAATGHVRTGVAIMRYGAAAFAALVLGAVLFIHLRSSRGLRPREASHLTGRRLRRQGRATPPTGAGRS